MIYLMLKKKKIVLISVKLIKKLQFSKFDIYVGMLLLNNYYYCYYYFSSSLLLLAFNF